MRSVRHRPIPSAPKARACSAWSGLLALARIGNVRHFVGPLHQPGELLVYARLFRFQCFVDEHLEHFAGPGCNFSSHHLAREAVDADEVVFFQDGAADRDRAFLAVDLQGSAANDADFAHLAADEGRVGGSAAESRDDAVGGLHAADVLGACFAADQNDTAPGIALAVRVGLSIPADPGLGVVGEEFDDSRRCPRARVDPLGNHLGLALCLGIEDRLQQLVQVLRRDAVGGERFFLLDQTLFHHIDRDADGGEAGAFAVASLQHPELALLDRELDVLDIAVVLFELRGCRQAAGRHRAFLFAVRRSSWGCECRPRRLHPGR